MGSVAFSEGGGISTPPLVLLSLADLKLVSSGIECRGSRRVSPSNCLTVRCGGGEEERYNPET